MTNTLSNWKSAGHYFSYKNHKIFVRHSGESATTILLLHGFPTASYDWVKMWDGLKSRHTLIALDFLGFGFSDKPHPYKYSIFEQVDLVKNLLASKGVTKVHILAHDYAVSVAQELLTQKQSNKLKFNIASVCFLNGGMFSGSYKLRLIQKLLLSKLGPAMVPFVNKGSLRRNFKAIFGKDSQPIAKIIDESWELIIYNNGKRTVPNVIQYLKDRKQHATRWTDAIANAKIPLRLINGPIDPISGQLLIDKYKAIAKNPDVIILQGIGHYPNIEAPEEVTKYYEEFLNKII